MMVPFRITSVGAAGIDCILRRSRREQYRRASGWASEARHHTDISAGVSGGCVAGLLMRRCAWPSMCLAAVRDDQPRDEGERDHACDASGHWRRFGWVRDGGAAVGGAGEQGGAGGSRNRLRARERRPTDIRDTYSGSALMNPSVFLEKSEGPPKRGCGAGLLRAGARSGRRVFRQRAGRAARGAGGLRSLERDRREGMGLEFRPAVFPTPGNGPGFHRSAAWRTGADHGPAHADGAMGRFYLVGNQGLERTRLSVAAGYERRIRGGILAAAAVQRR